MVSMIVRMEMPAFWDKWLLLCLAAAFSLQKNLYKFTVNW